MSNKTSDKNVANIEDDVKILRKFINEAQDLNNENGWHGYYDVEIKAVSNALQNILSELEQMLKEREKYTIRLTDEEYRKVIENAQMDTSNDRVIAIKFAIMQQQINEKDKRIQELEQALLKVKDKNTTLFITCRNSIPKQVVIDKIKELDIAILECEYDDDDVEEYKNDVEKEKRILLIKKSALEELLEEK